MNRLFSSSLILLSGSAISLGAQATSTSAAMDTVAVRHAVETARLRMKTHGNTGFSIADLKRTRDWFTPDLFSLLLRDMSGPDGPGYLNSDPFTDAQDDVGPFRFDSTSLRSDTVFVAFSRFDSYERRRTTVNLGMKQLMGTWRIATFLYPSRDACHVDLARTLATYATQEAARVPMEARRCRD